MADLYRNQLVNSYPNYSQSLAQVNAWDIEHQKLFSGQMQVLLDSMNSTAQITPADASEINQNFVEMYNDALAKNRDLNIQRYDALAAEAANIEQLQDAYEHTLAQIEAAQQRIADSMQTQYSQTLDKIRQKAAGVKQYMWATMGDNKVRDRHDDRDGHIYSWKDYPAPGDEFGCRCIALPVSFTDKDASGEAEPVYPELLLPIFRALGLVRSLFRSSPKPLSENAQRNREVAEKIANGHAYDKHVVDRGKFPEIKNRSEFRKLIEDVMNKPDKVKELGDGRMGYLRKSDGTVVVENLNSSDNGTAFRSKDSEYYFDFVLK